MNLLKFYWDKILSSYPFLVVLGNEGEHCCVVSRGVPVRIIKSLHGGLKTARL